MKLFLGIVRYEYAMAIRRWGVWLAFLLLGGFMAFSRLPADLLQHTGIPEWQFAAARVFDFNMILPVVGGIVLADRIARDRKLGVDELLFAAPLKRWPYILGKYMGGLLSVLTPALLVVVVFGIWDSVLAGKPGVFPMMLVAFLAITLPAFAFITAFSLACPVIIPVRVYQVLFTGYWFWGNYLSPDVMPTLNGTLLTASGEFAMSGFFGGAVGGVPGLNPRALEAVLNLGVLGLCAAAALVALERYLALEADRA